MMSKVQHNKSTVLFDFPPFPAIPDMTRQTYIGEALAEFNRVPKLDKSKCNVINFGFNSGAGLFKYCDNPDVGHQMLHESDPEVMSKREQLPLVWDVPDPRGGPGNCNPFERAAGKVSSGGKRSGASGVTGSTVPERPFYEPAYWPEKLPEEDTQGLSGGTDGSIPSIVRT